MFFPTWLKRLARRPAKQRRPAQPRAARPGVEVLETRRVPSTFTVSNALDATSAPEGSLRWAIQHANADTGATRIEFAIPGRDVHTINLVAELPALTRPMTIDGTTQPGYAVWPMIELNGTNAGATANGLVIAGGNVTVEGLVINRFNGDGIHVQGPGGNVIANNFIGVDPTGLLRERNSGSGVAIVGSANNVVGGTDPSALNLISGNRQHGVFIGGAAATGNQVVGNYIGADLTGLRAVGNEGQGVFVSAAPGTTVGGTAPGAGNVISGNQSGGVWIEGTSRAAVQGNLIGTDYTGQAAVPNGQGVALVNATDNVIGGTDPAARNVISGNNNHGVWITGAAATRNQIQGNYIGTDVSGGAALGNGVNGVYLVGSAHDNTVGGTAPGAGNVIAGTGRGIPNGNGIQIADGATGTVIQGNLIGTDATGTVALANSANGVLVNAPGNTVGGTSAGALNVIAGNAGDGVTLFGAAATGNAIQGNYIGTDASGGGALGNARYGVDIMGASANTVGGTDPGAGNVISGNLDGVGVSVITGAANNNLIQGNLIGVDASGVNPLRNLHNGVVISGASRNTVGGTDPGAGNVISANGAAGVSLTGVGSAGNSIQGNLIGVGADGVTPLGNHTAGVAIAGGAHDNAVGGPVAGGNVIADNAGAGVDVTVGPGNAILGNTMFRNGDATVQGIVLHGTNLPAIPVLTAASSDGSTLTVQGTYSGAPNTNYILDFFANTAPHPSGFGEGEIRLGVQVVTTDGSGQVAYSFAYDVGDFSGMLVSATATPPSGTTSQYAQDVLVQPPAAPGTGLGLRTLAVSLGASHGLVPVGLTPVGDDSLTPPDVAPVARAMTRPDVDLFFDRLGRNPTAARRTPPTRQAAGDDWNVLDLFA